MGRDAHNELNAMLLRLEELVKDGVVRIDSLEDGAKERLVLHAEGFTATMCNNNTSNY